MKKNDMLYENEGNVMLSFLSDSQAMYTIKNRDFPDEILKSNNRVAVVVSQSWCPQWIAMKGYLKKVTEQNRDIDIYILEYDKKVWFNDFMSMKEIYWKNLEVPYIRFYIDGLLVNESNFISRSAFVEKLSTS